MSYIKITIISLSMVNINNNTVFIQILIPKVNNDIVIFYLCHIFT